MVVHKEKQLLVQETTYFEAVSRDLNNHVEQTNEILSKQSSMDKNLEKKKKKRSKEYEGQCSSCSENSENGNLNKIRNEDLEELRTVYQKCKEVMCKIESKYGHLFNLDESDCKISKAKSHQLLDNIECHCTINKKIIFDEDGKEISTETAFENHICPKKLKIDSYNNTSLNNLQVQYENEDPYISLPDDITSLSQILQDTAIETTYRNKVIQKLKLLKQEYTDEVRFNKRLLVEKLKSNPNELFEFSGSNLNELPGYIY